MKEDMKMIKTGEIKRICLYNRFYLLFGFTFIGVGIIVFIFVLWGELLINTLDNSQWIMLVIRITSVICIITGIVGFIAVIILKKPKFTPCQYSYL